MFGKNLCLKLDFILHFVCSYFALSLIVKFKTVYDKCFPNISPYRSQIQHGRCPQRPPKTRDGESE